MSDYNLDEVQESFKFTIGGHAYTMRYPTTEEVQETAEIKDPEKQTAWLYGFISPDTGEAPAIEDAIKKVNVKVLQNFNNMIKTEFSSEN